MERLSGLFLLNLRAVFLIVFRCKFSRNLAVEGCKFGLAIEANGVGTLSPSLAILTSIFPLKNIEMILTPFEHLVNDRDQ